LAIKTFNCTSHSLKDGQRFVRHWLRPSLFTKRFRGGSGVTYFASGRYQNTNGPYAAGRKTFWAKTGPSADKLKRGQFSATLGITPSNKLNIRLSSQYSKVKQETIDNNNNIYGVISLAMFGKPERVVPLNSLGQGNAFGNAAFSTVREASYQQTRDNTDHANVSLSSNYKLTRKFPWTARLASITSANAAITSTPSATMSITLSPMKSTAPCASANASIPNGRWT
jgi:hypothetical protein